MAAFSDAAETLIANFIANNTTATRPTAWFLALFTAAPNDAGGGTEVSGSGYARQAITFGAAASGVVANTSTHTFTASGDVGTQGGADGAATGTGTATGSVGVSKPLTGSASGSGAATGAVLRLATINGVAVGTGTASGAVGRTASVTGAASGTGTASGETGYTGAPEPEPSGSNWMIDRRRRRSAVR